jgi:hydroxyacylglutathione hydrolase
VITPRIFEQRVVGPLECNCYVVGDPVSSRAIVIDPGGDASELADSIAAAGLTVTAIVATHAHFDHVAAAAELQRLVGAPFLLHRGDLELLGWMQESGRLWLGIELPAPPVVDRFPQRGDVLAAGDAELEVVHTPGHSPGSISLAGEGMVFSGDTLFAGSVGRTDLPGGDGALLLATIEAELLTLEQDTIVHPGHGPATTIERERLTNPFVGTEGRLWRPGSGPAERG